MTISKQQPMREAEIAILDYLENDPVSSEQERATQVESELQIAINTEYSRATNAENTLTNLYGNLTSKFPIGLSSLDSDLKAAIDFVNTLPAFELGYSESITIPAASTASVDVTFDKVFTEKPYVFTEVMCNTLSNILVSHVTYVDTTKATIKLYNGGTTAVQNVTVDYLALAGR